MSYWLDKAAKLEADGKPDDALDVIYDTLDDLIIAGEYDFVDNIISRIDVTKYSLHLLLGVASVTYYAAERLPLRTAFVDKVKKIFKDDELSDAVLQSNILK